MLHGYNLFFSDLLIHNFRAPSRGKMGVTQGHVQTYGDIVEGLSSRETTKGFNSDCIAIYRYITGCRVSQEPGDIFLGGGKEGGGVPILKA